MNILLLFIWWTLNNNLLKLTKAQEKTNNNTVIEVPWIIFVKTAEAYKPAKWRLHMS
jgi:hypothetical protein